MSCSNTAAWILTRKSARHATGMARSSSRRLPSMAALSREYTVAAAATWNNATVASSSTYFKHQYNYYQQGQNNAGYSNSRWSRPAAAMAGLVLATGLSLAAPQTATTTRSAVLCEGQEQEATRQQQQQLQDEEEDARWVIGPDDPYYTIPEQDEPTDCQMCLTFRQGPCRLDWKRFELCVKDQDPPTKTEDAKDGTGESSQDATPKNADEGSTACMKYAMPFYTCSHKHVNTYLILGNEQTEKAVIKPLLESYLTEEAQSRRLCYNPNAKDDDNATIHIQWQNWEGFVAALYDVGGHVPTKFDLEKTGFASAAEALKATWKDEGGQQYLMMNDEGVPYLISVTADVPKDQPQSKDKKDDNGPNNNKLMMTFALDQNGNLIGDARNKELDDETEKDGSESVEPRMDASAAPVTTTVELHVQLVPGVTKEFTIYSLYVPKDGDFLEDGILVESKPYVIDEVTQTATQKTKQKAETDQSSSLESKATTAARELLK